MTRSLSLLICRRPWLLITRHLGSSSSPGVQPADLFGPCFPSMPGKYSIIWDRVASRNQGKIPNSEGTEAHIREGGGWVGE